MGDKKLRSDIVNLRVVAILAVIFGHSTTIYWYNWTDYRTTQEAPVFAHVGNLDNARFFAHFRIPGLT